MAKKHREAALKAWKSKRTAMPQRFWNKVKVGAKDSCWPYLDRARSGGYGGFRLNGRTNMAHRIAWEIVNGPIPDGLNVLHKCDNPVCCNPFHCFLGTQRDNMQDASRKHRWRNCCGEKSYLAKLTDKQALQIRAEYRHGYGERIKLAKKFGISPYTISDIIARRTFTHI